MSSSSIPQVTVLLVLIVLAAGAVGAVLGVCLLVRKVFFS